MRMRRLIRCSEYGEGLVRAELPPRAVFIEKLVLAVEGGHGSERPFLTRDLCLLWLE